MKFFFNIEPVPQGKPMFSTKPYPHMYYKARSNNFRKELETLLAQVMKDHMYEFVSQEVPLLVDIYLGIEMPKSYSKKKKEMLKGAPHTIKPDIDNYVKNIFDAMTGIVWERDEQVSQVIAKKVWAEKPFIDIEVYPMDECRPKVKIRANIKEPMPLYLEVNNFLYRREI